MSTRPRKRKHTGVANTLSGSTVVFSAVHTPSASKIETWKSRRGITVATALTAGTTLFIQSYNEDDDDRLADAHTLGIPVVPPSYFAACVDSGTLLPFREFALHGGVAEEHSRMQPHAVYRLPPSRLKTLFPDVVEYVRELEELPQTVGEFIEMDRRKSTSALLLLEITSSTKRGTGRSVRKGVGNKWLPTMQNFLAAFFGLEVDICGTRSATLEVGATASLTMGDYVYPIESSKVGDSRKRSVCAMDLIEALNDAVGTPTRPVFALVTEELYDGEGDDAGVVMGRATGDGACVVSTAGVEELGQLLGTLAHEGAHMLGLDHCAFSMCTMNALVPADDDPVVFDLCPVCLRKLEIATGCDVDTRYAALRRVYESAAMDDAVKWIDEVVAACSSCE